MKPTGWAAAALVAAIGGAVAHASDMTGVYARVEKVVVEPGDGPAERIQVWGVFALAAQGDPNTYHAPVRGYLYYKLPSNAALARREWADLKSVAGTDQIVAVGARYIQSRARPHGRKPGERPRHPPENTMDIRPKEINRPTDD